eukprot:578426_1
MHPKQTSIAIKVIFIPLDLERIECIYHIRIHGKKPNILWYKCMILFVYIAHDIITQRICDNGMKGPLFEIYAEDDPTHVIQHKSLTTPWQTIIENISKRAKEVKCDGQRESNGTSGPRWLGLRDYLIMGIIELLPNTQKCTAYWRSKAKQNLPYTVPKPFFSGVNQEDIIVQKSCTQ